MEGKPSLTTARNPLQISKTFKDIPYYRNKSLTTKDIIQGNPYHITEIRPLLYKETRYCGRKTFPYYRRKPLTNKEPFKGIPCYRKKSLYYGMKSLAIEDNPLP